jgi:hypothetical protein
VPLPQLKKAVLYLDQNAISNMMKALNPSTKAYGRPILAQWRDLFRRIDHLCKLQLLVCPRSPTHARESAVSPYNEALVRMSRLLAGDAQFYPTLDVRLFQIARAVRRVAGTRNGQDSTGTPGDVTLGHLHGWWSPLQLSVEFPTSAAYLAHLRAVRRRTQEQLEALSTSRWLKEGKTFDEWVEDETQDFERVIVEGYLQFLRNYKDIKDGRQPASMPSLDDVFYRTMDTIRREFVESGADREEALQRTLKFLSSRELGVIPEMRISSMLWAARALKAAAGQRAPPRASFATDVGTISAYLPYCDAMFVDNECRALLAEEPVRSRLTFPTRVFSVSTWDQFTAYLDELLASCPEDQRRLVRMVYGDSWEQPFETMYAAGRG